MPKLSSIAIAVTALVIGGSAAHANLVTNGGFEITTAGPGLLGSDTNVVGWTDGARKTGGFGQDYVYAPGTADTKLPVPPIDPNHYDDGELYGPDNHVMNGLPDTSPAGGNFVGLNAGINASPLSQVISGLQVGKSYVLTFDYAFAQGFGGKNVSSNDSIGVSLLGQTFVTTPTVTLPAKGFSGWTTASFKFTDTGGSDVLSFLANGTSGAPPYALLDGVSLNSGVPEPAAWAMMLLGIGALGACARRNRALAATANAA